MELGCKWQLFDRRLTLNFSLVQGSYDDYQMQINVPNPDPLQPPTLKVASVDKVRAGTASAFNTQGNLAAQLLNRVLDRSNTRFGGVRLRYSF